MKKVTSGFRGHLLIYTRPLNIGRQRQQKQIKSCTLWMVCLWLSLFFSSSFRACTPAMRRSSSWKRELVQSECRSIHEFWIIQEKGEPQKTPPVRLFCTPELDHCGGWERFSHQPAASQDYLSDFQSRINWAQLLGKAKTPRMQCCQHNLSVPAESWGIFSCLWWASRDDASFWSIEAKC